MRNHKSPSCLERSSGLSSFSKKFYSVEEVTQIIKNTVTTKLNKIYQQLQQKQNIIKLLNEKLNKNDHKLAQQTRIIDQLRTKSKQNYHEQTIALINNIVNEKLQNYWVRVQGQLQQLRRQLKHSTEQSNREIEQRMLRDIQQLKLATTSTIDNFKKKNNAYWLKVKQALNKVNAKTQLIEDKTQSITNYSEKVSNQRKQINKISASLQQGRKIAKMFNQLKKSIENVYQSYKQMLNLQSIVKVQYEQNCSLSLICQEGKNMKPRSDQDLVILQYSKQQSPESMLNKETGLTQDYYGIHKRDFEAVSPLRTSKSMTRKLRQSSEEKDQTSLWSFNNDLFMHSRTINLSMDSRKEMCENIRQRLLETIKTKSLHTPLRVSIDRANNLKNQEGHFMFDLQGTMFKVNAEIFGELQREGIIEGIKEMRVGY